MMILIAEIGGEEDGTSHPDDLEVILLDGDGFSIKHENEETGKEDEIYVFHEHQAKSLIRATKAMCAALGWEV